MRRLPGDKIDVWLVRYNGLGPANFWGFKQLSYRYRHQRHMHAAALPITSHVTCQHLIAISGSLWAFQCCTGHHWGSGHAWPVCP